MKTFLIAVLMCFFSIQDIQASSLEVAPGLRDVIPQNPIIQLDQAVHESIAAEEVQVHKFTVTHAGRYLVSITGTGSDLDWCVFQVEAEQVSSEHWYDGGFGQGDKIRLVYLMPGEYYVAIYEDSVKTSFYDLEVKDLGPLEVVNLQVGQTTHQSETDRHKLPLLKLTIENTATYKVAVTNSLKQKYIAIFDSNLNEELDFSSCSTGADSKECIVNLPLGTYYLYIVDYGKNEDSTTPYDFVFNKTE